MLVVLKVVLVVFNIVVLIFFGVISGFVGVFVVVVVFFSVLFVEDIVDILNGEYVVVGVNGWSKKKVGINGGFFKVSNVLFVLV